ncbi:hypothetical protein F4861DRAFT_525074 [Xylaria intraflava]|nr:hypothetical protein F4861DRAFT_525074 [Xylaria intraflava]
MAQSVEALQEGLREATRQLYAADPNTVTVNSVRQRTEKANGLEKGFFITGDWKARSKTLITEFVQTLIADDSPPASQDPEVEETSKNGVKRSSSDELFSSPKVKRQKKAASVPKARNTKPKKESSSSALSELSDSDVKTETKKRKTASKKATARKPKSDSSSELTDLDLSDDEPKQKKKAKPSAAPPKSKEESESELSDPGFSEDEPTVTNKSEGKSKKLEDSENTKPTAPPLKRKQAATKKKQVAKRAKIESDSEEKPSTVIKADKSEVDADVKVDGDVPAKDEDSELETKPEKNETKPPADDSDSSLSSVLDEPPPEKRRGKHAKGASKSKPSTSKELTVDEVEIKKLQGQLVKCGVRKIWGIEMKKYGADGKAKIRHLKNMLHDVGMDGRFSEAKAREIKEKRELMGELEAVNEMNELWGLESRSGRASRSKAIRKSVKEESSGDEKEDDETKSTVDGDNEKVKIGTNSRVSKRMADLAFLGSDSESE